MNLCVKACLFAVVTACSVIPPTCARPIVRDTDIDVRLRTDASLDDPSATNVNFVTRDLTSPSRSRLIRRFLEDPGVKLQMKQVENLKGHAKPRTIEAALEAGRRAQTSLEPKVVIHASNELANHWAKAHKDATLSLSRQTNQIACALVQGSRGFYNDDSRQAIKCAQGAHQLTKEVRAIPRRQRRPGRITPFRLKYSHKNLIQIGEIHEAAKLYAKGLSLSAERWAKDAGDHAKSAHAEADAAERQWAANARGNANLAVKAARKAQKKHLKWVNGMQAKDFFEIQQQALVAAHHRALAAE